MLRAIVNADDFGISEEVNDAIVLCFEKRIITSTTLMVNMPYAMDAVNKANEYGFADRVGLHLNLTAGTPLTMPIRSMRRFCDKKGDFHAGFHQSTSTRLHLKKEELEALYIEIEAQMRRYISYGLAERHLDSHHHVHTDIAMWGQLQSLIKKYNFRSVRIGRNMLGNKRVSFNRAYKHYYNGKLRRLGVVTTDYFGSFKDFVREYDNLPDGSLVEVMLHPMFSEDGVLMDTKTDMSEVKSFIDGNHILTQAY